MEELLSRNEMKAILGVNRGALQEAIMDCERLKSCAPLEPFKLFDCGQTIRGHLHKFANAISEYAGAVTVKKRERTYFDVHAAGRDLNYSVQSCAELCV